MSFCKIRINDDSAETSKVPTDLKYCLFAEMLFTRSRSGGKKTEQYYILFFNLIFKNAFLSISMESNKEILVS